MDNLDSERLGSSIAGLWIETLRRSVEGNTGVVDTQGVAVPRGDAFGLVDDEVGEEDPQEDLPWRVLSARGHQVGVQVVLK